MLIPSDASAAVLLRSEPVPESAIPVQGPNFENSLTVQQLLQSYERIGFQATSLSKAIDIVNKMVCVSTVIFVSPYQTHSSSAQMASIR